MEIMNRKDFIKRSIILGAGLLALPSFTFGLDEKQKQLLGLVKPKLVGDNYNLTPKASEAFLDMRNEALKEGIKIYSQSSYRSYYRQKGIWDRKYNRYTNNHETPEQAIRHIIEYSTIPGTSRHHWGTDLDIVDHTVPQPSSLLTDKNFRKGGAFENLHEWMNSNLNNYGFHIVYTNDKNRKGFKYEPWHISFKEESLPNLENYLAIDLKKELQSRALLGSNYFSTDFISNYKKENLLDINPILRPNKK